MLFRSYFSIIFIDPLDDDAFEKCFTKCYRKLQSLDTIKHLQPHFSYGLKDLAEYYGIFNKVPPYTRSTTITSLFSKNHHRSSRMSNFNSDHFETTSTKQGYSLKKVNTFVPMPIHKRSSSINRLRNNYKSLRQNSSIISNFDKKVHLNYVRKTKNNSRLNLTQLERIVMGKNLLNKSNKNSRDRTSVV